MTSTSIRIRARHACRKVNASVRMTSYRTRECEARDPYTGDVVRVLPTGDIPSVHASGAFHAYPFGMPDVPRYEYPRAH